MTNLLDQAINCNDGDRAAKMICDARSASRATTWSVTVFPKQWPANREQRANIIAEWLETEARFLGERYGS